MKMITISNWNNQLLLKSPCFYSPGFFMRKKMSHKGTKTVRSTKGFAEFYRKGAKTLRVAGVFNCRHRNCITLSSWLVSSCLSGKFRVFLNVKMNRHLRRFFPISSRSRYYFRDTHNRRYWYLSTKLLAQHFRRGKEWRHNRRRHNLL